jgi:tryptophan synthase alpha chain
VGEPVAAASSPNHDGFASPAPAFRASRVSRSMGRISARFAELKRAGRGALIPYLEAWDPDHATSMEILRGMPDAGADLIEIGMPFTDPMADGPIIQAAGKRGLKAGVKVRDVLTMVHDFRRIDVATPVILMGYLNPILSYGVDGLIIVDLPPEESDILLPFAKSSGLDFIRLVAPTTDAARLPQVMRDSSGFVYYVAITGITGTRSATSEHLSLAIPRIRKATDLPIAIGFGVRTPAQAAEASRIADAAVVASALIETLSQHLDENGNALPGAVATVLEQVRGLAAAVRAVQG